MVYLSSVPHSYAVFDSATAVSWRKLQKTTSPGTLHRRCTHSKPVGTLKHNTFMVFQRAHSLAVGTRPVQCAWRSCRLQLPPRHSRGRVEHGV